MKRLHDVKRPTWCSAWLWAVAIKEAEAMPARANRTNTHVYAMLKIIRRNVSCRKCGMIGFCEFDHIDPTLKSFNLGHSQIWNGLSVERINAELAKVQPLCRHCHRTKTIDRRVGVYRSRITRLQNLANDLTVRLEEALIEKYGDGEFPRVV